MSTLKNLVLYSASNSLTAVVQFCLTFLFAQSLGSNGFGQFSLFTTVYIIFTMVVGLGLSAAVQHAYFQIDSEKFRILVSTTIKSIFSIATILGIIIETLSSKIPYFIIIPQEWLLCALAASTGQVIFQIYLIILQCQTKTFAYLFLTATNIILQLSFAMLFLWSNHVQWKTAALAYSVPIVINGLVAVILIFQNGYSIKSWSWSLLKSSLKYSTPLIPHQVSGWIMSMSDRFIITYFVGLTQVGVYSFSFQIAQAVNVVSHSINQAYLPTLYLELSKNQPNWKKLKKINLIYGVALLTLTLAILLIFLALYPYVIPDTYRESSTYIPWLLLAFFLLSISRIASNYLMFFKKTNYIASSSVILGLISLVLNIVLIQIYGTIAACWVSAGVFLLLFITTWQSAIKCQKQLRV